MRQKPGRRGMPFKAVQVFAVDRVAVSWRARFHILGPMNSTSSICSSCARPEPTSSTKKPATGASSNAGRRRPRPKTEPVTVRQVPDGERWLVYVRLASDTSEEVAPERRHPEIVLTAVTRRTGSARERALRLRRQAKPLGVRAEAGALADPGRLPCRCVCQAVRAPGVKQKTTAPRAQLRTRS